MPTYLKRFPTIFLISEKCTFYNWTYPFINGMNENKCLNDYFVVCIDATVSPRPSCHISARGGCIFRKVIFLVIHLLWPFLVNRSAEGGGVIPFRTTFLGILKIVVVCLSAHGKFFWKRLQPCFLCWMVTMEGPFRLFNFFSKIWNLGGSAAIFRLGFVKTLSDGLVYVRTCVRPRMGFFNESMLQPCFNMALNGQHGGSLSTVFFHFSKISILGGLAAIFFKK